MTQVPGATVFAVDDDESFLTAIGRVLRLGGYTVEAVPSADGVSRARAES